MELSDKNILLTGSGRGIGWALAKAFAREGSRLHLVQRSFQTAQLEELRQAGAREIIPWTCDLSDSRNVLALGEQLAGKKIDLILNNAGTLTGELLDKQSPDEILQIVQVNLTAALLLTRLLLPSMIARGSGKIVNNTSVSAIMRFPCATTYAATKAGLLAFTECLETELKGTGVSTLALITPGIQTEMFDEIERTYGRYFNPPQGAISSDTFARQVIEAIQKDKTVLWPGGSTRIGLWMARWTPQIFKKIVIGSFSRHP